MKRFTRLAVATFALLVPSLAAAQAPLKMAYRPELRTMVPVKPAATANPIVRSRGEEIARHQAMARGYMVAANHNGIGNPAVHCERAIAELRTSGELR